MKDLLVLRDLECVKAIAHPRRIDILNAFDKDPLSAKQLSEMLDEPHAKINYHIKTLYNVGILELVEEKIKSGIVEKYYYPTAKNVVMSRKIIDYTLDPESEEGTVSISDFENTVENFYDAVEQGSLNLDKVLEYRNIQLTDAEIVELQNTMKAKVSEILANRNENEEQKKHDLLMVAIPMNPNDNVTE
ncbi:MAG: ArsR/SmtB family transcription factor [Intestinibacter sp.]